MGQIDLLQKLAQRRFFKLFTSVFLSYFQWLTIPKLGISKNIRSSLCGLLSMREFGKRVLSVFLVKMVKNIADSFDVYVSGRLGRERNLYQRDEGRSKGRRGGLRQQNLHVFLCPLYALSTLPLNQALVSIDIFCFSMKL